MGARVLRRTAQPKLLRHAGLGRGRASERRSRRLTAVLALVGSLAVVVTPAASGVPGDPTPPVITPVLTGTLGNGDWYVTNVTVNWRVSDPESLILSSRGCDATTLTADTPGARLSCEAASDGGEATASKTIKVDKTAPTVTGASAARAPDGNGWYNHALVVSFAGFDATSGVEACSAPSYGGPDSATASVSGSCRDRAGHTSALGSFTFKYDATAPDVTPSPSRGADANGWYNRPLTISFLGSDAASGVESCGAPQTYAGPDSSAAAIAGSCRDRAGNSGQASVAVRYDATAPTVNGGTAARAPDVNGWYNHPLVVSFAGSDDTSRIEACGAASYDGPDSATASVSGSCRDRAGNTSGAGSFAFKYDATAPDVTASPSRAPDRNGWYNGPLTVSFSASDAASGVETCSAPQGYDGPDAASATVGGSCRDRAGNVSPARPFALKYDSTPPSLARVRARPGNRRVALSWRASPDVRIVDIERSGRTVYRGAGRSFVDGGLKNGGRYGYVLTASDEAGNAVRKRVVARPAALFSPAAGARVSAPPLLAWAAVPEATYYNVQLIHGRKVLSAWPGRPRPRLPRSWGCAGRRYRLAAGRYRWYVWPGLGRRAAGRYGRLVGGSSFVVTGP
jgi:hypothetical protein